MFQDSKDFGFDCFSNLFFYENGYITHETSHIVQK